MTVPRDIQAREVGAAKVVEHIQLLCDAKLVVATFGGTAQGKITSGRIERLTWAGHEFLSASKDESTWQKVRTKVVGPTISWTWSILLEMLKEEAKAKLGLRDS